MAEILEDRVCTCGVIMQEVLQGVNEPRMLRELSIRMSLLPYLETSRHTHVEAASLFQRCRLKGIPVHTIDACIAATAIEHGVALFTLDRGLQRVSSVEPRLRYYA